MNAPRPKAAPARRVPVSKRALDVGFVLLTLPLTLPLALIVAVLIRVIDGGPILYRAHRAGQGGVVFEALKFRTMRDDPSAQDHGVSGGNKTFRISPLAAKLRRTRLDEVPQLWNVLRGDMSLVGPRPPDPHYVETFPEIYGPVLQSRPGLTGLATLHMHRFEDRVLRACKTPEDTEAVYRRRCIPRKARLDLIYQARPSSVCFDIGIIVQSIASVLR